jgi:hypothetical protein
VAGYDKIAGALDISPAHLAAYEEAVEKALDAAIATRSTPPRVYKKRIYPAGLFKFGGNLVQGQFVLLKDKQPDPALPVRGGFEDKQGYVGDVGPDLEERKKQHEAVKAAKSESAVGLLNPNLAGYEAAMNVSPIYAGMYRMKLSLWGFQWNAGKPEPGPDQAAVLRAHEEGKQQEGGRLLRAFTAPSGWRRMRASSLIRFRSRGMACASVRSPDGRRSMWDLAWRLTGSRSKAR